MNLVFTMLVMVNSLTQKRWGVFNQGYESCIFQTNLLSHPEKSNPAIKSQLKACARTFIAHSEDPLPCYSVVFDNDYFWTK